VTVPAQRLTAHDVYRYLGYLADAFAAGDELIEVEERDPGTGRLRLRVVFQIDRQLARLERVLAHFQEPYHSQAMGLVSELKQARMSESRRTGLPSVFVRLRMVVADWDRQRRKRAAALSDAAA
jgi:hypothetical protein